MLTNRIRAFRNTFFHFSILYLLHFVTERKEKKIADTVFASHVDLPRQRRSANPRRIQKVKPSKRRTLVSRFTVIRQSGHDDDDKHSRKSVRHVARTAFPFKVSLAPFADYRPTNASPSKRVSDTSLPLSQTSSP